MALGAIEAAGKPLVPIVGVNSVPDAIAAIKSGKLLATGSFDAMKMACLATEAALRYLSGETAPREILLRWKLSIALIAQRGMRLSKKLDSTVGWR